MNEDQGPSDREPGSESGGLVHVVPLYAWQELKAICEAAGGQPARLQFRLQQDERGDFVDVVVMSTVGLKRGEQATIETRQRLYLWEPDRDRWTITINGKRLVHQTRVQGPSPRKVGSIVAQALNLDAHERTPAPKHRQRQIHRDASHRTTGRSSWSPRRDGSGPSRA